MLTTHNKRDANVPNSPQQAQGSTQAQGILLITGLFTSIGVVVGATVWILNITDIVWSNSCMALFTAIGTLLTMVQLYIQFKEERTLAITTTNRPSNTQPLDSPDGDFSISLPGGQEGRLVIYTKRSLRGFSVDLCQGYRLNTYTYAAQNIVEYKTRDHACYIAIFESLLPGPYTAHILRRQMTAKTTIYPGKVTTIDWR